MNCFEDNEIWNLEKLLWAVHFLKEETPGYWERSDFWTFGGGGLLFELHRGFMWGPWTVLFSVNGRVWCMRMGVLWQVTMTCLLNKRIFKLQVSLMGHSVCLWNPSPWLTVPLQRLGSFYLNLYWKKRNSILMHHTLPFWLWQNRNPTVPILPIKELLVAVLWRNARLKKLCFLVIWEGGFLPPPLPSSMHLLASDIHAAHIIKYWDCMS